jgi:ribonucleoside-triphosphate reductase
MAKVIALSDFQPTPSVPADNPVANPPRHVVCQSTVDEYLSQSDWRVKANANVGYSNAGLVSNLAGKVIANYWLDEVYSTAAGEAHRNADIHIHDLDCLTGYCAGWSLRQVLNEGFNCGHGRVGSRPPNISGKPWGKWLTFWVFYNPNGRARRPLAASIPIWRPMYLSIT